MTAAYRGTPRRRPVPVRASDDLAGAGVGRLMERRAAVVLAEAPTTDDAMLRLLARREGVQLEAAAGGRAGSCGPVDLTDPIDADEHVEADPAVTRLLARRAGYGAADGPAEDASDVARLLARREDQAEPAPAAGDDELTRLLSRRAWTGTAADSAEASEVERLLARRSPAEPENADPALARLLARRADTEE